MDLFLYSVGYQQYYWTGTSLKRARSTGAQQSTGNMNTYQNSEDENMKHICNICGKQTISRKKLKQHQDEVHKSEGFKCTECDQRVESKSYLSKHIRAIHERVKYHCGQCNHNATSKGNLAKHKRAFNERVKYPCGQLQKLVLSNKFTFHSHYLRLD